MGWGEPKTRNDHNMIDIIEYILLNSVFIYYDKTNISTNKM